MRTKQDPRPWHYLEEPLHDWLRLHGCVLTMFGQLSVGEAILIGGLEFQRKEKQYNPLSK